MNLFHIRIHQLLSIHGQVLLVFYAPGQGYQFRVLTEGSFVHGTQRLYQSEDEALRAANDCLVRELS